MFWKYSGQIFTALMHFSLAGKYHPRLYPPILSGDTDRNKSYSGGFSSPKLASVMHETNYLTSDAKEATYKRLLETTLFVLDVRLFLPLFPRFRSNS